VKRVFRVVLLAAFGWAAWAFWPNDARKIRKNIEQLAAAVSFSPRDGNIARLAGIESTMSHFTADAEIQVDTAGLAARTLSGAEEIRELVALSRRADDGIQLDVFDIVVTLGPGPDEASGALTATARSGATELVAAQEFVFRIRKVERRWLIQRIQAVRTLRK
jgi:hypothetical protein